MSTPDNTGDPAFDYAGYTVTTQAPEGGAVSYSIVRDLDGTGLGAYHSHELCQKVITSDRAMIASLPKGLGWIPPVVNPQTAHVDGTV